MPEQNRPLSPHLGIYSWQVSNTLSILHRFTGVVLSVGALALVAWITAAAMSPTAFANVMWVLGGPLGLLILFGFSASFFYHLGNGIRHLFWDAGYGFEKHVARASGWFVLIAAVLVTAVYWFGVLA